jgi:cell division protein FtsW (lipid II flippase)
MRKLRIEILRGRKLLLVSLVMLFLGLYLIGDGVGSIIIYNQQSSIEHVPRLMRAAVGGFIIFYVLGVSLTWDIIKKYWWLLIIVVVLAILTSYLIYVITL